MTVINIIILLLFCVSITWTDGQVDVESFDLNEGDYEVGIFESDSLFLRIIEYSLGLKKLHIQIFYEVYCPHCITFGIHQLAPVVNTTMSSYLHIATYPFGNAKVIHKNDKVTFECQHGPTECYGNKLHACALFYLKHKTALLYNICLMNSTDGKGSDDESADRCGKSMDIESAKIKDCAKSDLGTELLRYMGHISKKANFKHVPYVLINGKVYNGTDFKNDICALFKNPPPPCTKDIY